MFKFFAVLIGTIALAWGTQGDDIGAGPKRKYFSCFVSSSFGVVKCSASKVI